jgi:HEAT repeat protein
MQKAPVGTIKRRLHEARQRLKEEMMHMVENVLKSEAPKDDFPERVFLLLSGLRARRQEDRLTWEQVLGELKSIGTRGAQGFARALESPHSGTRVTAAAMARMVADPKETLVDLLKKSLADPNRKVRRFALDSLLHLAVDEKRKRREFVPLAVPLLTDPSKRVRRAAAYELIPYWQDVPMDAVVRALVGESDRESRKRQKTLLHPMVHGGEMRFYTE